MENLDVSERRKRYTDSRVQGERDADNCPCGKAMESGSYTMRECEQYKGKRRVLEWGIWEVNEGRMESFRA